MSGVLKYTLVVQHPDTLTPVALLAGKPVPEWAEDLVHEDDYAVEAEPVQEPKAYADAKVATLADEIASRNEGRAEADLIVPAGKNKPDLIAALEADDQKS